ncbi:MAG: hypothetical protein ABSE71_01020 [Candidatus Micrarchaeaceae archaeon]|jgi:dephospho-CoA kinase
MEIIILVGKSGCGKTEASKIISAYGYERFEASRYATSIHSNVGKGNFDFFMEPKNQTLVAKKIENDLLDRKTEKAVISGLRMASEINYFKERYENVHVVGIYASDVVCYQRTTLRKSRKKFKNLKEFSFGRLYEDYAHGLGYIYFRMLDHILDNNTDNIPMLERKVYKLLEKVGQNDKEFIKNPESDLTRLLRVKADSKTKSKAH